MQTNGKNGLSGEGRPAGAPPAPGQRDDEPKHDWRAERLRELIADARMRYGDVFDRLAT